MARIQITVNGDVEEKLSRLSIAEKRVFFEMAIDDALNNATIVKLFKFGDVIKHDQPYKKVIATAPPLKAVAINKPLTNNESSHGFVDDDEFGSYGK
jgi:hypothetical protein